MQAPHQVFLKLDPIPSFEHCLDIRRAKIQQAKVIHTGGSDPVYGLGYVGALVYDISHAASFQGGIVGFFKAIVWPAIFVYEALKFLEGIKTKKTVE